VTCFLLYILTINVGIWLVLRTHTSLADLPKGALLGEVIKNDDTHLLIKLVGGKETMLIIEGGVPDFSEGDVVRFSIRNGVATFEPQKRKVASVTVMAEQ
jgi:hypothetical protein